MMSLFSPSSSVVQTPDAASMVPLTVVRQVLQEVADARASNLAFRQAVSDHETANTPRPVKQVAAPALSSGSRGGGRARGGPRQPANKGDLRCKPPSGQIPSSVPRNIPSMLAWDIVKFDTVIAISTSQVETNFLFTLTQHPQAAQWTALFDQWCIPQASVTFRTEMPPGTTQSVPMLYTALDFDSLGNLGSISSIEDFSTCQVTSMSPGRSVTRSIKPCVKMSVQTGGSNTNASLGRVWQDSGSPGTSWFGIRSIIGPTSSSGFNLIATSTIWYAFRSQI